MKLLNLLTLVAAVLPGAGILASCATVPVSDVARIATYRNVHDVQFEYPGTWRLQDMSKSYGSLAEAEREGAAYIQVFSYNPLLVGSPAEEVPQTQVKVAILLSRNPDRLDYRRVLDRVGDRLVEKSVFTINGKQAYRLHYRITSQERSEKLDVLAIEYIDGDLYVRFICYPWNSSHVKEFEALAQSFRYKGR
jgi:hypothetical protein